MTTTEGEMIAVATVDNTPYPMDGETKGRLSCFSRSRNFWTFACGLIVLVAALGGLIFVVVDRPSVVTIGDSDEEGMADSTNTMTAEELKSIQQQKDAYYLQLRHAVINQVYNGKYDPYMFMRPNSPQRLAMQWMAYEDTLHLPLNVTASSVTVTTENPSILVEAPTFRWIQRYVLMTIYFGNDGDGWAIFGAGGNITDTSYSSVVGTLDAITEQQEAVLALAASSTLIGSSWASNVGIHECQWELIGCDAEDHIIDASFSGVAVTLSGMLPKEIGLLSHLRFLDVSENDLKGTVPEGIYGMKNLEHLDLSGNQFVSEIDARVGLLQNLTHLSLRNNLFFGAVPSTLTNLTSLKVFSMASNADLGGPILNYTVQWEQLEYLDISETVASGTIPTELGLLTRLTSLSLWSVLLSGTIPSELGQLVGLEDIVFGKKRPKTLVGNLPSEISRWTNMIFFRVVETEVTGTIPSGVGSWSNAQEFVVRNSQGIQGTIPTEMGLMTNLEKLQLFDTSLRGTIPSELGLLTNAEELMFHLTKLRGTMPDEICQLDLFDLAADCLVLSDGIAPKLECGSTCCSDCFAF